MPLRLYMDEHVPKPVTVALRRRGIDVLTAQEDGTAGLADDLLLARAGEVDRVLFSQDQDLIAEATRLQRTGGDFMVEIVGPDQ